MAGMEIHESIEAIREGGNRIQEICDSFESKIDLDVGTSSLGEAGESQNGIRESFMALENVSIMLKYLLNATAQAMQKIASTLESDQETISKSFDGDGI